MTQHTNDLSAQLTVAFAGDLECPPRMTVQDLAHRLDGVFSPVRLNELVGSLSIPIGNADARYQRVARATYIDRDSGRGHASGKRSHEAKFQRQHQRKQQEGNRPPRQEQDGAAGKERAAGGRTRVRLYAGQPKRHRAD